MIIFVRHENGEEPLKRIFIIIGFAFLTLTGKAADELDSLFRVLEESMAQREHYDLRKENRIGDLKSLLVDPDMDPEKAYHINNQIINEYGAYKFDSTLLYTTNNLAIARGLGKISLVMETSMRLTAYLASSGRFKEAYDIISSLERKQIPGSLLKEYYERFTALYDELSRHATLDENRLRYARLHTAYTDSLIALLDPNSNDYMALQEFRLRDAGMYEESKKINTQRMAIIRKGTRDYSIVTFQRSLIYEMENNISEQKKYLVSSAISDIQLAIKDNASLTALALLLYEEKDIDRAHRYITYSMEDARFFNSETRFVLLSGVLPVINETYQMKSKRQKNTLRFSLLAISVLSLILLLALLYIFLQVKSLSRARNDLRSANKKLSELNEELHAANEQLNRLNEELTESSHIKEHYIGNFFSICANYIDKLDNYRKNVSRHISDRKVQELYESTKSSNLIDSELQEFYHNFDNIFLSIFPTFIEDINTLIVEEERIQVKKGELLNTELRVFALIRLGISDSSKIAKLLHYSVNTIYNYRVKIKNKAAGDREKFEEQVMRISSL